MAALLACVVLLPSLANLRGGADADGNLATCAPQTLTVEIANIRLTLPFDDRIHLSPAHRRSTLHALKRPSGLSAVCRATDGGRKPYRASQIYLFARTSGGDAICPANAALCATAQPTLQRFALSVRDQDSIALSTTQEDFARSRARDPWKSEHFVIEAAGRVTRFADEYRSLARPEGPLVARCWPVGPRLQCDASEMLTPGLRLEWTIIAPIAQTSATVAAAERRVAELLAALRTP